MEEINFHITKKGKKYHQKKKKKKQKRKIQEELKSLKV